MKDSVLSPKIKDIIIHPHTFDIQEKFCDISTGKFVKFLKVLMRHTEGNVVYS